MLPHPTLVLMLLFWDRVFCGQAYPWTSLVLVYSPILDYRHTSLYSCFSPLNRCKQCVMCSLSFWLLSHFFSTFVLEFWLLCMYWSFWSFAEILTFINLPILHTQIHTMSVSFLLSFSGICFYTFIILRPCSFFSLLIFLYF